jgi:uncharacterized protein YegP (UPF0339 family)
MGKRPPPLPSPRIELYEDAGAKFRWRRVARNGQIVSTPGQGYKRSAYARKAARREYPALPIVRVDAGRA